MRELAGEEGPVEAVLRHDRAVVLAGLAAVAVVSWGWVVLGAGMGMNAFEMTQISKATGAGITGMPMAAMQPAQWDLGYALLMFVMWWVMMVAMMLPSAAPMLLLYARIHRKSATEARPYVPTGVFAFGYLAVWGAFSAAAAGLQWSLQESGLVSSMLVATNAGLGGLIVCAAGLWQLTPIKEACLRHCRSPISFVMHHWRPGRTGAFRMGLDHGVYCLGCCWFLMGLLFYGGVMNLYWIGGLALFVLLEKTVPAGHWLGRAVGVLLIGWGGAILVSAAL